MSLSVNFSTYIITHCTDQPSNNKNFKILSFKKCELKSKIKGQNGRDKRESQKHMKTLKMKKFFC